MQESNRINEVDLQYAKTLIELGTEKNIDHREILEMLEVVNKAFLENSDIYKILNHPNIKNTEKQKIIANIVNEELIKNFLFVLIDNKRLSELPNICNALRQMVDDLNNIKRIEVISSYQLTLEKQNEIIKKLSTYYQKDVEVKFTIDEKIIAGIIIKTRDEIINQSLLQNILNLKNELKGEVR